MEPEKPDRQKTIFKALAVIGGLLFVLIMSLISWQLVRISRELGHEREELKILRELLNRSERTPPVAIAPPIEKPIAPVAPPLPRVPPPTPPPVAEPLPPKPALDRISLGLGEFRAGRVARAHVYFARAVPDAFVHLAMSSMALGFFEDALFYLGQAMEWDRDWLRRLTPGDLFRSPAEYASVLAALEARVSDDPLDGASKTLLAFLYYYEKGPDDARLLLVEAASIEPDQAEAKAFLEALDR